MFYFENLHRTLVTFLGLQSGLVLPLKCHHKVLECFVTRVKKRDSRGFEQHSQASSALPCNLITVTSRVEVAGGSQGVQCSSGLWVTQPLKAVLKCPHQTDI